MNNARNIFVGRGKEIRRLREAILARQSLIITGENDTGKTALIMKVIGELPLSTRQRCLYIGGFKDLRDLLQRLVAALFEKSDTRLKSEFRAGGITKTNLSARLKQFSSSRLRGTLYHAVQGKGYRVFLDHCPALTPSVARVVKELFWMRQTPVYLVPSTEMETEIAKACSCFYWGEPQVLRLGPVPPAAARTLMEHCIREHGLENLELAGFRREVLELSHAAPGAIVAMCRMAANPSYQSNGRIKTRLIHIDYMMRGSAPAPKSSRTGRDG
jgi:hypothetical protein